MPGEFRCAIEFREDETRRSPGRLVGTILRYGERAADRAELFEAGALHWPADGVVLNRQHSRTAPIARVTPEERDGAVLIDTALPDTAAGRDAAEELRAGLFRGLSVEFNVVRQRFNAGVRVIQDAVLSAVALVDTPAYAGSACEVRKRKKARRWRSL